MKLTRLSIERLPGISNGFVIDDLAAGLNVVLGPNASGKSSLCRAVRALLYEEEVDGPVSLEADFEAAGEKLHVARQGREFFWTRDGSQCSPPELPDSRLVRCFTVQIDDLLSDGETEQVIRERVRKILAGGYDLAALRGMEPFVVKPQRAKKEQRALRDAESQLAGVRAEQQAILADERRLDGLRSQKADAARARDHVAGIETALELLSARREVGLLEAEVSSLPADMGKLTGAEKDSLERLGETRSSHEADLAQAQREIEEARNDLKNSGLEGSDLDESALSEHAAILESLRGVEGKRETADSALMSARQTLESADRELGVDDHAREVRIDSELVHRVEEGLSKKRELDARDQALADQLLLFDATGGGGPGLDALRNARNALSRWLASPRPSRSSLRSNLGWILLLVGLALAAISVAAWKVDPWLGLLALPVLLVTIALVLRSPAQSDHREDARDRFSEADVEGPQEWTGEGVLRRFDELEREVAAAERRRIDDDRRDDLERKRQSVKSDLARVSEKLRTLAEEIGFDPNVLDASFDRWVRLVQQYDEARREVSEREGERKLHAEREAGLRAGLLTLLGRHGESPQDASAGAEAIAALFRQLQERVQKRDRASERLRTAERDAERARKEIRATSEQIENLFTGAGLRPNDEAELLRRLERLGAWTDKVQSLNEKRVITRDRDRRLGNRVDLRALVDGDDEASLRNRLEDAQTLAAQHERFSKEITLIEERIEQAKTSHDLEQAQAVRSASKDELERRLEEDLFTASAQFLLDDVQRRHLDASRPAVLRRAGEWFAAFTRHAFALEPPAGEDDVFLARDVSADEPRTLAQLSSGTRMQLLLALRLAFAVEAERGRESIPIFLDEALTVADPERYGSVVECLHDFARRENRQVFYLTAQPGDVLAWEQDGVPPKQIRLHEVRRLATAFPDPADLELPQAEEIPPIAGLSAAKYGRKLNVPRTSLWGVAEEVHIFHLLRDDLPLLQRLLEQGIRTVGQLRNLLGTRAAAVILAAAERDSLEWRIAIVPAVFEACRQGRGRPVDREVLDAAGVTSTFLERLTEVVAELGGDGKALLEAIDAKQDERVKRFQAVQRDKMERHFEDEGYIDRRRRLTVGEVDFQVLGVVAHLVEQGKTTAEQIREVTRSITASIL